MGEFLNIGFQALSTKENKDADSDDEMNRFPIK